MKIIDYLLGFFRKAFGRTEEPSPEKKHIDSLSIQRKETRKAASETGSYLNLKDLLSDCDAKFSMMDNLKYPKHKKMCGDTAALMRHFGCFVPSMDMHVFLDRVETPARPQFLFCSLPNDFAADDKGDRSVFSDFVWLEKMSRLQIDWRRVGLVPKDWEIYEMGVGMPAEKKWQRKHTGFEPFALIALERNGVAHRIPAVTEIRVRNKTKKGGITYYSQPRWGGYTDLGDIPAQGGGMVNWVDLFTLLMNTSMYREMHWSVTVACKKHKLCFSIPDNDAPRFFSQREMDGKKIFHAVRAHHRKTRSGLTNVKTHYRGNRHFRAGGYEVTIQMPGLHRKPLTEFPDFKYFDKGDEPPGFITVADAAKKLGPMMRW